MPYNNDAPPMIEELTEEHFDLMATELEDECTRSNAYREAAISLIDGIASSAVERGREERSRMIKISMPTTIGFSGATH